MSDPTDPLDPEVDVLEDSEVDADLAEPDLDEPEEESSVDDTHGE